MEEDDGSQEAMADACRRAGFTPKLRYRIGDRKMRWDLIVAGRAISLCRPTSPHAEGTVLRPLAGDPLTGRIRTWTEGTPASREQEQAERRSPLHRQ